MTTRAADEAKARRKSVMGSERLPALNSPAMTTTFHRFRLGGQLNGLVRRTTTSDGGSVLAYVGADGWVADQSLLQHWVDPGDVELVEVSREEATAVAESLGVDIDEDA